MEVSLEDAFHGAKKSFSFNGKKLEVTIPKGVKDGQNMTKRESFAVTKADRAPKTFTTRLAAVGQTTRWFGVHFTATSSAARSPARQPCL